ncbi:hypothetical protein BSKO_09906 [Bryopsis sp. KO-2023]|nr:hypothetical protein BSKO_09906 [Bryopsis sp. KO-2023]
MASGGDVVDGRMLTSLGDWFWESVFSCLTLSERAVAEVVCRKWAGMLRTWLFWEKLVLSKDDNKAGQWSVDTLDQLVVNSMGSQISSIRGDTAWPRPSPIKEIDMTGCSFRAVSPLKILDLVVQCPNLEVLKLTCLRSSLTGTPLVFHSKDFEYINDMVAMSGGKLKSLELDVRVQSSWSAERQAKWLDPNSWGQLLEWLAWEDSLIDIRKLEILNIPSTAWDFIDEHGELMTEETAAVEENIGDLGNALCMTYTVEELKFGPDCRLGEQGAIQLMQIIKYNMSISTVSMCGNGITTEAVKDMARVMTRDGPPLLKVDLRENNVNATAAAALREAMKKNIGFEDVQVLV